MGSIFIKIPSPALLFIFGIFFLSPSLQPAVINPVDIPWYTTPFFAILLVLGMFFYHQNKHIKLHPIILPATLLAILPIFFHFSSEFIYQQFFYISFIITSAGLIITGYNLDKKELIPIFYVLIIAAYIWSISALIVWFDVLDHGVALTIGDWMLATARSVKINGPFANGNVFAILIFCAWLISLWFWLRKSQTTFNFWLFSMFYFWVIAFLSLAKGAYLVHLIPLSIVLFYCFRKKLYLSISILCISAIAAFFLASELNNTLSNQEASLHVPNQLTSQLQTLQKSEVRPLLYASIYEIWLAQPYIGVGYGKIKTQYLTAQASAIEKYNFEMPGIQLTTYGHNTVLHLMAEAGLIGLLLSLIITLLLIKLLSKNWKDIHPTIWPITMILVMLWLQGMINITLARPFPILLFSFLLGISLNQIPYKQKDQRISKHYLIIPLIISATLLLTLTYSNTSNWRNYEEWITLRNNSSTKRLLLPPLLKNPSTMPFIVAETARGIILSGSQTVGASLLPHIEKALQIQETENLYQALFFSQVYNNNFKAACETGKFIQSQHWKDEGNNLFYKHACQDSLTSISTTPNL